MVVVETDTLLIAYTRPLTFPIIFGVPSHSSNSKSYYILLADIKAYFFPFGFFVICFWLRIKRCNICRYNLGMFINVIC